MPNTNLYPNTPKKQKKDTRIGIEDYGRIRKDGLVIFREKELCDKYMGKFPVISISLKEVGGDNFDTAKRIVNSDIKRNNFLTLHMKAISKYFFKKATKGISTNFDSQFEGILKTVSEKEREYINENYDMVKSAIISAVKNDGIGIYYDACALCQKRDKVCISSSIPVFIWNGTEDDTTPVSYAEYLAKKYSAKQTRIINDVGHMMYLLYWKDIVLETLHI